MAQLPSKFDVWGWAGRLAVAARLGLALSLLLGCSNYATVVIRSRQPGAQVYVDGRPVGVTPATIRRECQSGSSESVAVVVEQGGHRVSRQVILRCGEDAQSLDLLPRSASSAPRPSAPPAAAADPSQGQPRPKACKGVVRTGAGECDFFVVEAASAFHLLRWRSGHRPAVGEQLGFRCRATEPADASYPATASTGSVLWVAVFDKPEPARAMLARDCSR